MIITIETEWSKSEYTYDAKEQILCVRLVWERLGGAKVYMLPDKNQCFLHNITPAHYAEIVREAMASKAALSDYFDRVDGKDAGE